MTDRPALHRPAILFGLISASTRVGNASDESLGSVTGITLRDVTVDGPSVGNFIAGFSANRRISDVRFERLRVNGTLVTSAAAMGLELGPFTSNVTFG